MPPAATAVPSPAAETPSSSPAPSAREAKRQAKRDRRQRVRDLKAEGRSVREIASHLRVSAKTVLRVLRTPEAPHGRLGTRGPSLVDPFRGDVEAWLGAGNTNTADLYRVPRGKGCRASYDAVRRYANRRLGSSGRPGRRPSAGRRTPPPPAVPSPRELSFPFVCPRPPADGGPSRPDRVRASVPAPDAALTVAGGLADMLRRTAATPLADWRAKAGGSGVPELVRFAASLATDAAAVSAAMTGPWSDGPAEGQVGRRKAIKRSMFGRCGLDLLRARVMRKG